MEDNLVNQKIAKRMFAKMGYEVGLAQDGQEALDRMEAESFDLVFMDVQMPVMDGLTATQRFRESHPNKDQIIIAMTANAMPEDREACLRSGMDDYLTKPIKPKS